MIDPTIVDEDSSAERSRRARLALVISIVLNLIGVGLFWHLFVLPREPVERRSPVETVTITKKRPLPIPVPPRIARVVPSPKVRPKTKPVVVSAAAPPPEAPHPTPHRLPPRNVPHRAELAKNGGGSRHRTAPAPPVAGVAESKRTQFNAQKIAAITQDLQGEIDADRGSHGALAVAPEPAPTMKRFAPDLADLTAGGRSHHGLCDPIRGWQDGGYDYYYVACNVRFSDGTFQRQDVPWPIRFVPSDDPFTGTSRMDKPLAPPLPGWHLGPGESVTVELREYAHDHGVDI